MRNELSPFTHCASAYKTDLFYYWIDPVVAYTTHKHARRMRNWLSGCKLQSAVAVIIIIITSNLTFFNSLIGRRRKCVCVCVCVCVVFIIDRTRTFSGRALRQYVRLCPASAIMHKRKWMQVENDLSAHIAQWRLMADGLPMADVCGPRLSRLDNWHSCVLHSVRAQWMCDYQCR